MIYIVLLVTLTGRNDSSKLRQSRGINTSIAYEIVMKAHVHQHTMVIYIQYKFHEIAFIGYVDMAEDGKTDERKDGRKDRRMDRQRQTYIPQIRDE